ncbi:hypothetical protein N7462_008032 [Penicillium macrosclerotiorum]|uniref:uncharacterized protein n=1 Tax=Penicillium macrosclerotiorum TaxID=303699 RepID=UPI0025472BDD|nr:uncharacterized protein N7462_008032 [Penicillium macrosclerotiorum]KAJ5679788.1 hypothetical protein N7462_008032 [Penicillium macrosclerotiorum]
MLEPVRHDTVAKLIALRPEIEAILENAGTAGCSLGVIHNGEIIHADHFGYRDVEKGLKPDDDTIYPICSLSKSITAATVGILVGDGEFDFDTRISDLLADFNPEDPALKENGTLTDLLSHRSGLQGSNFWLGSQNNVLFPAKEAMRVVNSLKMAHPFRTAWEYSNYGYEIIAHIIKQKTGSPWFEVVSDRILKPLDMSRTGFDIQFGDHNNVARAYATLDNAIPVLIEGPKLSSHSILGAGGGIRSSLKDMLTFYRALLLAESDQQRTGESTTTGSPFKNTKEQFKSQINLSGPLYGETGYGFGLARATLPSPMGSIGTNPALLPDMPIVGRGLSPTLALYHQGTLAGAFATVILFPETVSGIIVLTNSVPLGGSDDWIGQLLTETLFDAPEKNDYRIISKKTADSQRGWHDRVLSQLPSHNGVGDQARPLGVYAGKYYNKARTLLIHITEKDDSLTMNFQDNPQEFYKLTWCSGDTFTWLSSRNELASRGRFTRFGGWFYTIKFSAEESGRVVSLNWIHDEARKDGDDFYIE